MLYLLYALGKHVTNGAGELIQSYLKFMLYKFKEYPLLCIVDMIDIDRQIIRSFWSHIIA